MSAGTAPAQPPVVLDGTGLSCEKVRAVAREGRPVVVGQAGLCRARRARAAVQRAVSSRPVYGRTTGVGANRSIRVTGGGHGLRLLRSHAGGAGPMLSAALARAMLAVRLNQLAAGGSGVDPALLPVLAEALNLGLVPPVRAVGAIGTGDLGALASAALCILGERPWLGGTLPPFRLDPADALAFMSSNAATIGEAAIACADLADLVAATPVIAALSFLVVRGSPEPYAAAAQRARPHSGQTRVAARMRELLAGQEIRPARIQDPYGYRALPQVHGPAADAVRALGGTLAVEMNAAAENPLVDAASGDIIHNGNFYTAYLGLALDAARTALFQTAALSAARLGTLVEPAMTGLRPFLAGSAPASSGVLSLEYVAHSALADIRRLASPAALGTAVLSRGLEEQANFSTQAARAATETVAAYRIVTACELVAAVRGLRMRGVVPAPGPLLDAYGLAAAALDSRAADRPLDADIDAAERLLPALGALLTVEEDAVPGGHLLVVAQPGPGPGRLRVGHRLDDHRGQHGRCGVRVEDQAGAHPGGQQDIGVAGERDETHVGDDRGAHAEAPCEPECLHRLGRVPGQGDRDQPAAARLADVQQSVEDDTAAEGEAAHVGVNPPGGVGEILGQRRGQAMAEHGQRRRGGQFAAQFGDGPGVGQPLVQRTEMGDLRGHRRLHLVTLSRPGREGGRPGGDIGRARLPGNAAAGQPQGDRAQCLAQRGIAGKAQDGREPGDRRLADPGPLRQRHAGQEGRIGHVVEQILRDTPLRGRQPAPAEQPEQCVSRDAFAVAALHRPSLADRRVQIHSHRRFSHGLMPELRTAHPDPAGCWAAPTPSAGRRAARTRSSSTAQAATAIAVT